MSYPYMRIERGIAQTTKVKKNSGQIMQEEKPEKDKFLLLIHSDNP